MTNSATLPTDPDLRNADIALRRAALNVKKQSAIQGTPYVIRKHENSLPELFRYANSVLQEVNTHRSSRFGKNNKQFGNRLFKEVVNQILKIVDEPDSDSIQAILSLPGLSATGSGTGTGSGRGVMAVLEAIKDTTMYSVPDVISSARGVLLGIYANSQTFTMNEFYDVLNTLKPYCSEAANVYLFNVFDSAVGESVQVSILLTGLNQVSTIADLDVRNGTSN